MMSLIEERKPDSLLTSLNNYHPSMNFTVEANHSKILDTKIKSVDVKVDTSVYKKPDKMVINSTTKVRKRYKSNGINSDFDIVYNI